MANKLHEFSPYTVLYVQYCTTKAHHRFCSAKYLVITLCLLCTSLIVYTNSTETMANQGKVLGRTSGVSSLKFHPKLNVQKEKGSMAIINSCYQHLLPDWSTKIKLPFSETLNPKPKITSIHPHTPHTSHTHNESFITAKMQCITLN